MRNEWKCLYMKDHYCTALVLQNDPWCIVQTYPVHTISTVHWLLEVHVQQWLMADKYQQLPFGDVMWGGHYIRYAARMSFSLEDLSTCHGRQPEKRGWSSATSKFPSLCQWDLHNIINIFNTIGSCPAEHQNHDAEKCPGLAWRQGCNI